MIDILTNPITLLCLGVVFLLISLLFFYFKRNIALLERSQMEQAHILQSFITNMEISKPRMATVSRQEMQEMQNSSNSIPNTNTYSAVQQNMIPVSDDEDDNDSDSDSDSDDSDSDDSDSDDGDSDDSDSDDSDSDVDSESEEVEL